MNYKEDGQRSMPLKRKMGKCWMGSRDMIDLDIFQLVFITRPERIKYSARDLRVSCRWRNGVLRLLARLFIRATPVAAYFSIDTAFQL